MFCTHCGKNIPDGVRFCTYCGSSVESKAPTMNAMSSAQSAPRPAAKASGSSKKTMILVCSICGAVIVLALGILFFVKMFHSEEVNLNDYVSVQFDGYNSQGTAVVVFDNDAFLDDFENKIKYKGGKPSNADDYYSAAEYMINELVDYSIDNPTGLSNGDTVVLKWNVDEYGIQNDVKVKARCRDTEFKVEGLQDAEAVDVFQNLDVSFQGDDGSGYVVITNNNTTEPFNSWTFSADTTNELSNGDKIVVSVDDGETKLDASVSDTGKVPTALSREYTVTGLSAKAEATTEEEEEEEEDDEDGGTTVAQGGTSAQKPKKNNGSGSGSSSKSGGNQVFPDSSSRLLTAEEVGRLSEQEVQTAINEIYARNGYMFHDTNIYNYFCQYDWYSPVTGSQEDAKRRMNSTENANIELLEKFR